MARPAAAIVTPVRVSFQGEADILRAFEKKANGRRIGPGPGRRNQNAFSGKWLFVCYFVLPSFLNFLYFIMANSGFRSWVNGQWQGLMRQGKEGVRLAAPQHEKNSKNGRMFIAWRPFINGVCG